MTTRRRIDVPPGYQPSPFHAGFIQYYNTMHHDDEPTLLPTEEQLTERDNRRREAFAAFERSMTAAISRGEVSPADQQLWARFQEHHHYFERAAQPGSPEHQEVRDMFTQVLGDTSNPLVQGIQDMATRARAELNGVTDPAQRRAIQDRYMSEAMARAQRPENAAHMEAMMDSMAGSATGRRMGLQTSAERRAEAAADAAATRDYMAQLNDMQSSLERNGFISEEQLNNFMRRNGHESFADPLAPGGGARVTGTTVAAVGVNPDHGLGGLGLSGGGPGLGSRHT